MQKKSIIKRQMLFYTGTIIVCVFLLGVVLSTVYSRHYMDEKRDELILQEQKISKAISEAYHNDNLSNLSYELHVLEEYMNAGVLLVNESGIVMMSSPGLSQTLIGKQFGYQDIIDGMLDGNVIDVVTKTSSAFDVQMLIVGYPIEVGQMGGILICRSMPEIQQSLYEMYKATMISFLIVFIFGLIISYITYKRLTRPLIQMSKAASVIANGNFDQRVNVGGDDELAELAESFNHMAESLENHEANRREFIANVSHDLRSPLTSMQGFLTAMLDGTIPPERQEKYITIVLEETQRLSRMTEGIVELSRAENSRILLNESDFDLNELLRNEITLLEPQLNEKEVVIKAVYAQQTTLVHADRDKISRVIQNLLGNAVKFSELEGCIEVETTVLESKKVLIAVTDFGCGIPEEDQKYIFDRFYKGDTTRNHDKIGSGIGLSIVKAFILAHGETITVQSEEGKGATFAFSLKLSKIEA